MATHRYILKHVQTVFYFQQFRKDYFICYVYCASMAVCHVKCCGWSPTSGGPRAAPRMSGQVWRPRTSTSPPFLLAMLWTRVILIGKFFLDQIVHVPKLFPLLHWSENIFCFLCSSTPSHGDKNFSASMGILMGK